ncbi:hypothetical protein H257_03595 [Aphanomyces astaci]|uniref:Beta-lactamase-related domain-containing protein n=2 Tax=Aphanomyces astaci TaxID=112090 RepID=W4GZL0_APHAT|nr:hypothetical protein H257_03595 [Aphanomyces astaci]ETV84363.1 hypothetical protein H257_03595 [Aphanomyces astaci]|eukprot:XP_009826055.1 hypothetical protein H257_03595 [Aphanomyces astaci]
MWGACLCLGWLASLCVVADSFSMFKPHETDVDLPEQVASLTSSWDVKKMRILEFVTAQHAASGSPGWALAVVHHNETLLAQGFGLNEVANPANQVSPDSMFHIGSVTKTMVAVALAKLVDEGRVRWTDRVTQHLPWFTLHDKYAQTYTTLHDLLGMNSVFAEGDSDYQASFGVYSSERDMVQRLGSYATTRTYRQGYAYANVNFAILGQVVQAVTNQTWGEYLTQAIWTPLGMMHTYDWAEHAPADHQLSKGHFVCNGTVAGPFDIRDASTSFLAPFPQADGSVVSSIHDMAIFSKFLLSKGRPLFASTQPIADMITGHEIQAVFVGAMGTSWGYHFDPKGGRALGAGYGIDVVGPSMYRNLDYFDKNGDTAEHQTRTGFVPSRGLGVVLLNNGQLMDKGSNIQRLSRVRTYVLGILLDIPQNELVAAWNESVLAADALYPVGDCKAAAFDSTPPTPTYHPSDAVKEWLAGEYTAMAYPDFVGNASIYVQNKNQLVFKYGTYAGPLIGLTNTTFVWNVFVAVAPAVTVRIAKLPNGLPTIAIDDMFAFVKVLA